MIKQILNKQKLWSLLGYHPTPQQLQVHNSNKRWRVCLMGRRSGKSFMAAHEILPWLLTPRTRGWIVGPNYSLANKIAREVKRVVMTELKLPLESKKKYLVTCTT